MMTRWLRCYMSSCLYQMFSSLQSVLGRFTSTKWRTEYQVGFIVTPLMYYYVELNFYFWGSITEIFCKYPSSDCGIQSYRCKQMKSKLEVAFTNTSSTGEISVTSTRSLTVHVGCSCVHRWTKEEQNIKFYTYLNFQETKHFSVIQSWSKRAMNFIFTLICTS